MLSMSHKLSILLTFVHMIDVTKSGLISDCIRGSCTKPKHAKFTKTLGAIGTPKQTIPIAVQPIPSLNASPSPDKLPDSSILPYTVECAEIISILPLLPGIDSAAIEDMCRSRFVQLNTAHIDHQQALRRVPPLNSIKNSSVNIDSYLIVLDLDETIMDQSTFISSQNMYESGIHDDGWKRLNVHPLKSMPTPFQRIPLRTKRTNNSRTTTLALAPMAPSARALFLLHLPSVDRLSTLDAAPLHFSFDRTLSRFSRVSRPRNRRITS